ncbi:hypothetical protein JCGZ_03009 [Jatropha curcas]|uniref:Uncharacterized protein n=1 Tax=Jatropha curcas TaxID=180498 RepID=A0A067L143_JATCU|nr:hypothetical protein JCGZ_03009 [Jatropha curcas]
MLEFEDFLEIRDAASKVIQEQKSKARTLQSILAVEDAKEAERKMMEMSEREEMKEKAAPETKGTPSANEVVQAIKDSCDECIKQSLNSAFCFLNVVLRMIWMDFLYYFNQWK